MSRRLSLLFVVSGAATGFMACAAVAWQRWAGRVGREAQAWGAVLAAPGFGQRHLNHAPRWRACRVEAIFAWYLVHQTALIALAVWRKPLQLGAALAGQDRWRSRADPVAHAAPAIVRLNSMRSTVESGRIALAGLPAALLARPAVAAQAARGKMRVITDSAELAEAPTAGVPVALRAQGVRLGVPLADAGRHTAFDFILLPATSVGPEALLTMVRQCRAAHLGVMLVATGFASIDDLEQALQAVVALVAGRVDAVRATGEERPLHTAMQRICQLLNRVVTDQDAALIAQDIGADVPLSYRMLR